MILANSYAYMNSSFTTVLEIITVILPLILFCIIFTRKRIQFCKKKEYHYHYVNINNADTDDGVAAEENNIRYVFQTISSYAVIIIKFAKSNI